GQMSEEEIDEAKFAKQESGGGTDAAYQAFKKKQAEEAGVTTEDEEAPPQDDEAEFARQASGGTTNAAYEAFKKKQAEEAGKETVEEAPTETVRKEDFKRKADLVALAKEEGVSTAGNMTQIAERINEKRKASTAPVERESFPFEKQEHVAMSNKKIKATAVNFSPNEISVTVNNTETDTSMDVGVANIDGVVSLFARVGDNKPIAIKDGNGLNKYVSSDIKSALISAKNALVMENKGKKHPKGTARELFTNALKLKATKATKPTKQTAKTSTIEKKWVSNQAIDDFAKTTNYIGKTDPVSLIESLVPADEDLSGENLADEDYDPADAQFAELAQREADKGAIEILNKHIANDPGLVIDTLSGKNVGTPMGDIDALDMAIQNTDLTQEMVDAHEDTKATPPTKPTTKDSNYEQYQKDREKYKNIEIQVEDDFSTANAIIDGKEVELTDDEIADAIQIMKAKMPTKTDTEIMQNLLGHDLRIKIYNRLNPNNKVKPLQENVASIDQTIIDKLAKGEKLTKSEYKTYQSGKANYDGAVRITKDNAGVAQNENITQEDIDVDDFLNELKDEDDTFFDELDINDSAKKIDTTEGFEQFGETGLTKALLDRLHKQFPNVKVEIIDGLIEVNGIKAFGLAMQDIVKISTLSSIDTIPHEYAHIWVAMMRDTYAVKLGIKRYKTEEKLVQKIGEYYTNKMKEGTYEKNLMRNWLKKMLNAIKAFFGSTKGIGDFLAESFFNADFSNIEAYYDGIGYIVYPENSDVNNIAMSTGANDAVMFYEELGINLTSKQYREVVELAETEDDASEFIRKFEGLVSSIKGEDVNRGDFSPKFNNELKQFYQSRHSSIYYYTDDAIGITRSPWELIWSKAENSDIWNITSFNRKKESETSPGRLVERLSEKLLSLTAVENHLEHDLKNNPDKTIETHHIQKTDILKHMKENGKYDFYKKNEDGVTSELIERLNRIFSKGYITGSIPKLYVITASKSGDNSQLTFANVEGDIPVYDKANRKEFLKGQAESFKKYLAKEVSAGNMTGAQAKQIYNGNLKALAVNPLFLIQTRGIHEWAKQTRHPKYLHPKYWKGIEDFNNRLRIDMSEGKNPTGMDKRLDDLKRAGDKGAPTNTILLIDKEDIVENAKGKRVQYSTFDGATLTSGALFRLYEEMYGYKPESGNHRLSYAKTTIRDSNGDNYLGMKHAEFRLPKGLTFRRKDGSLIANTVIVNYNGKPETRFMDAKGNLFDRIASNNEAKNVAGVYENNYKIHTLTEHNIKLLTTNGNKSKQDAALPFAAFDMMLANINDDVVKVLAEQLRKYNAKNVKKHSKVLLGMLGNPSLLKAELSRQLKEGEIPGELQQIMLKDKSGNMLLHKTNIGLLRDYIANKYIKDNMFKGRRADGSQTKSYYQPDHTLELEDGQMRFGIGNKSAWRQAVNLFVAEKEGNKEIFVETKGQERLNLINNWLNSGNKMYALASRQPVNRWTTARPFRVMGFDTDSNSNAFHTHADVVDVFEGDWDGDAGYYDFFRPEDVDSGYLQAYLDLFERDKDGVYKSTDVRLRDKLLKLELFGEKLEQWDRNNILIYSDMYNTIKNSNAAENAVGKIVTKNAQWKSMALKEAEVTVNGNTYTMKQPTDRTLFPIELRKDLSEKDKLRYITNNGDKIFVHSNGKSYLDTTVEHVFSILTQAATDDAKFGLLSRLRENYIEDLMFKEDVEDADRKVISGFALGYFNQLGRRQGKLGNKELDMNGMLRMAHDMYNLYSDPNTFDEQLQASIANYYKEVKALNSNWENKSFIKNRNKTEIKVKNQSPTIIESMFVSLGEEFANRDYQNYQDQDIMSWADDINNYGHMIGAQSAINANGDILREAGYDLNNLTKKQQLDIDIGVLFAEDFNSDYQEIIDKYYTEDGVIREGMQFDRNEKFEEMFNEHAEKWNAMTDIQKQVATTRSLTQLLTLNEKDVATYKVIFDKLFPVRYQHDTIYSKYSVARQEGIKALIENEGDLELTIKKLNRTKDENNQLIMPSAPDHQAKIALAMSRLRGWTFKSAILAVKDATESKRIRDSFNAQVADFYDKGRCS
ncbi:MAG: hypothetical protein H8D23_35760, partial [Candidatus Brocadiales bacterium]|nr:hypothetical protein [Candidatus Brocadiales bacterium]